jgi:hypothetical protein
MNQEPVMIDTTAPTHGLPPCLRVPIAAASTEAIDTHVGDILNSVVGPDKDGQARVNAVLVRTRGRPVVKHPDVALWHTPQADEHEERLFPDRQVWVHVDYNSYRQAYRQRFSLPIPCPPPDRRYEIFLDHVQNRRAMRIRAELAKLAAARGYAAPSGWHPYLPYLRLCPVYRMVNTSGGDVEGGEGQEREYLADLRDTLRCLGDPANVLACLKAAHLAALARQRGRAKKETYLEKDTYLKRTQTTLERGEAPAAVEAPLMQGILRAFRGEIVYADPMDLTKMLNIEPGIYELVGVAETQGLFYPSSSGSLVTSGEQPGAPGRDAA